MKWLGWGWVIENDEVFQAYLKGVPVELCDLMFTQSWCGPVFPTYLGEVSI